MILYHIGNIIGVIIWVASLLTVALSCNNIYLFMIYNICDTVNVVKYQNTLKDNRKKFQNAAQKVQCDKNPDF